MLVNAAFFGNSISRKVILNISPTPIQLFLGISILKSGSLNLKELNEFQERDLGILINKFTPQLEPHIKQKEACVNIRDADDACYILGAVVST